MVLNFLQVLTKFLIFYSSVWLVGRAGILIIFRNEFKKGLFYKLDNVRLEFFYPLVGFFVIGNIAVIFNFILPLNNYLLIASLFLLIGLYNLTKGISFSEVKFFLLSTIFFPALLVTSFGATFSYDAGLYHLNNHLWLNENNIVFGFSNIYGAFGVSSLFEYVSSILWFDETFIFLHFLNILFIGIFYYFLSVNLLYKSSDFLKKASLVVIFYSILDNFGFGGGRNGFIYLQSVGNFDTSVAILFFIASILIVESMLSNNFDHKNMKMFSLLTLFLIQLKVSALPILFAYVVYLVKYVRKNTLYTFLNNNLLFIFLGFTWIIKSVIQTGCVVFPFSPLCFETLSWVDLNYIKTVQDISVAFSDSYVFNTGLNEWFKNYIENPINENVLYNFLLSFIIICFINIKNFKKIQNSELNLFLFSYLLIGSTYYIFFGPDLRYLMGFQIVLVSLIGVYMKKIVVTNKIIIIILLMTSSILIPRLGDYDINNFKNSASVTVPQFSNVNLYNRTYPSSGDQCWIDIKCSSNKLDYTVTMIGNYKIVTLP